MKLIVGILFACAALFLAACPFLQRVEESIYEPERDESGNVLWQGPEQQVVPEAEVPKTGDGQPLPGWQKRLTPEIKQSAKDAVYSVTGLLPWWGEGIGTLLLGGLGLYGRARFKARKPQTTSKKTAA